MNKIRTLHAVRRTGYCAKIIAVIGEFRKVLILDGRYRRSSFSKGVAKKI